MRKLMILGATLSLILTIAACNYSTASISDLKACAQLTNDVCATDSATFTPDTAMIYVSGNVNNAPEGTEISIKWEYLTQPQEIKTFNYITKGNEATIYTNIPKLETGWPAGDYQVTYKIATDNSQPMIKTFSVK